MDFWGRGMAFSFKVSIWTPGSSYIQLVSVVIIIHFMYVNQQSPFTPLHAGFWVLLQWWPSSLSFLAFCPYKMFETYLTHFLPQNTFPTQDLELVISPRSSGFFWWGMIYRDHNLGCRMLTTTLGLSLPLGFLVGRVRKYFFLKRPSVHIDISNSDWGLHT